KRMLDRRVRTYLCHGFDVQHWTIKCANTLTIAENVRDGNTNNNQVINEREEPCVELKISPDGYYVLIGNRKHNEWLLLKWQVLWHHNTSSDSGGGYIVTKDDLLALPDCCQPMSYQWMGNYHNYQLCIIAHSPYFLKPFNFCYWKCQSHLFQHEFRAQLADVLLHCCFDNLSHMKPICNLIVLMCDDPLDMKCGILKMSNDCRSKSSTIVSCQQRNNLLLVSNYESKRFHQLVIP
ncbi:hypothetical protein RFI_11987, partial [Reticulomyxa filosa]